MDDRLVTGLLLKFSDKRSGWVSVRRSASSLSVSEFVRAFETFAESESYLPRRLRRNGSSLRRAVLGCLNAWNLERNQAATSTDDVVAVELHGDQLMNVEFVQPRLRSRRRNDDRRARRPPRGVAKPQRIRMPRRLRATIPLYRSPILMHSNFFGCFSKEEEVVRKDALPMKGEIVIGNEYVGAILGRRGSTIQSIRARSGGQVHLCESSDGSTRMIEVYGDEHQVMEAHRQVNQIIHREYPEYLPRGIMVPMKTTIELKMNIELATYLTGMNRTMLSEIQATTGVSATLQDVEGDETSKLVILTGSFDKILDAHQAVLDTYEAWLAANHKFGSAVEDRLELHHRVPQSVLPDPVIDPRPASGEALQLSTALVLQPDGSYKEMQVLLPPPAVATTPPALPHASVAETPPSQEPLYTYTAVPRATRPSHHPLYVEERAPIRPARVISNGGVYPHREAQTAAVYSPLSPAVMQPAVHADPSQVIVIPGTADAAPNVYYTPALPATSAAPMILHPKGPHNLPY